ncbi:hypothetical protein ACE1B6_21610 [Aerosakkonemataceae cyanobacterium BLCC-F154]|uniref:Uncharacterized protein n=1 Tax=Floridaenema fluviatile BLCC-F154 TaxID=3153640 RepID=A0ABV4YGB6_9CYAN
MLHHLVIFSSHFCDSSYIIHQPKEGEILDPRLLEEVGDLELDRPNIYDRNV